MTNPNKTRSYRTRAATLTIGLIGVALAFAPAGAADELLEVTPEPPRFDGIERRTFELPLAPGRAFEDAVRVQNHSDEPLPLFVYAADAVVAADDAISAGERDQEPEGLASWISVDPGSFTLAPGAARVVALRVDIEHGEPLPELAAIVVETDPEAEVSEHHRITLLVRPAPPDTPTAAIPIEPPGAADERPPVWLYGAAAVALAASVALLAWAHLRTPAPQPAPAPTPLVPPQLEDLHDSGPHARVIHPDEAEPPPETTDEFRLDEPLTAPTDRQEDDKDPDLEAEPAPPHRSTQSRPRRRPKELNYIPLDEL